ncbi:Gfo/Idh/MocA family oxidoreductase [Mobilitalea sibirica]|uniref:Gfo/Idh/MocA family oxidoreductase n=1 Tax=Mobilitalea sibirica TaxID=1462919 RepID=A0A8J7KZM5_9FIRM|nr:Gfo/Idh/MocA family oxidoreductase [Mobilitalea sibirica]MBH1940518.1 Gfo/Idh/MocA family oxidoreductase [Mobilitalea sibirica]
MINVAIVGTGNISQNHIKGYLEFKDRCKIVALIDIYPEKAKAKAEEYSLKDAKVYSSHKDILDRKDIDLVSICTPPYVHAGISIDCMKAGMNVLCEKPMAASLEECDAMLRTSEETGKMLGIIAQNRFRDPIMNLKKTLDTGMIGKIVWADIDSYWWRGHSYYDLWWRGTWEKEAGGCTLNHAVHHIDMLNWMMGGCPKKVNAVLGNVSHDNSEVEDTSVAVLKYEGGAMARLTSSLVHHGENQKIEFHGEKAKISAPWNVFASDSKGNGFPERNNSLEEKLTEYYEALPKLTHEGHTGEIEDVLTALENGTQPMITGDSGRNTIELITAIYKSGFEEKSVELPIAKDDPWYTAEGIMKNVKPFYQKTKSIENFEDQNITVGSDYKYF